MKILVVDDNAIVRAGLTSVLHRIETVSSVYEAANASAALEENVRHSPEIILLDVSMPPGRSGLDILSELASSASVIMLTSVKDQAVVREALDKGAKGYLVHGQLGLDEVAGAIETCGHGGMVLGRDAVEVLFDKGEDLSGKPNPLRSHLTDREAQILELASEGASNKEIASRLFLAERTVKNYLNGAYPKIGVHNRAEAVAAWLASRFHC